MKIHIKYDQPKKLAGNILVSHSGYVSCPYNPDVVDYIRSMSARAYHSDTKEWEINSSSIADFCNKFTEHEITLTGIYEKHQEDILAEIPTDFEFKTKPFGHQIDGVRYGLTHGNFLLGDDQGLGKTKQIIDLSNILRSQGKIKRTLIICGVNSLKYNWQAEIETHSNEKSWVIGTRTRKNGKKYEGSAKDRLADLDNLPDVSFLITNIETLRLEAYKEGKKRIFPFVEKLQKLIDNGEIGMIAIDESHKCFDYDTEILTSLGSLRIGYIVENKIQCDVASYNEINKTIEYKPIVNYFKNDTSNSNFIELQFDIDGIIKKIVCTDDHKIFTENRGWVKAKHLNESDTFNTCNIF